MGRIQHRPVSTEDWGSVGTVGSGNVLGDTDDGTFKRYQEGGGSVGVYGAFTGTVPSGREIIAVRAGHRQRNTGLLGLYNGWPVTFLRINNARQASTRVYQQFPYQDSAREVLGPALYKKEFAPWTISEINSMTTDTGAAVGDIGPNRVNRWCVASQVFIQVIFDEPLTAPALTFPANGATVDTSSVNFRVNCPAPQPEQPVRAIVQAARDTGFTTEVRTFECSQVPSTSSDTESRYVSVPGQPSFTDLGPGLWRVRAKKRDYRGKESPWSATTSFTVAHGALPTPVLLEPTAASPTPTPYGRRVAALTTTPSGSRKVGVTWQFAKNSAFTDSVVQWTNTADGVFSVPQGGSAEIAYDPTPTGDVAPGLSGYRVSSGDPSQYLSQGQWHARVRATDVYGQSGPWSAARLVQVYHPPQVMGSAPQGGAAFDPAAGPVRWQFGDPWEGDSQSRYRVRVVVQSSGEEVFDTGEVASSMPRAMVTVPDAHQQQIMQLGITVWDSDGVLALGGERLDTFRLSRSPVVEVPFPAAGQAIVTGQPAISWTATFAGGAAQKSYRVRYLRADTGEQVYDTGALTGSTTDHTPPSPVLRNLTGYRLELTVTDTTDLSATLVRNFATNFELPAGVLPWVDDAPYTDGGYVVVHYPAGVPDPFFYEWRVYRRRAGTETWALAGAVQDPDQREFRDWLVAGSGRWEYSVVQVASRYGSLVESEHDPVPATATIFSDSYWFILPHAPERSVRVRSVIADKFTGRNASNEFVIIGGGTRVNRGGRIGKEGSLSAQVRASTHMTVDEQFEVLDRLGATGEPVMMRDPFGNVMRVALGDISVERLPGVGPVALGDIEIPYKEVR